MRGGTILPKGEWLQVYLTKCRIKLSQFYKMLNDSIEVDFTLLNAAWFQVDYSKSRYTQCRLHKMSVYAMLITQNVGIHNVDYTKCRYTQCWLLDKNSWKNKHVYWRFGYSDLINDRASWELCRACMEVFTDQKINVRWQKKCLCIP